MRLKEIGKNLLIGMSQLYNDSLYSCKRESKNVEFRIGPRMDSEHMSLIVEMEAEGRKGQEEKKGETRKDEMEIM